MTKNISDFVLQHPHPATYMSRSSQREMGKEDVKKNIKEQMEQKIHAVFSPHHIEIFDESHKHAGHSGNPDGKGETHIGIIIVSDFFTGKNRIDRARAVHSLLAEEIKQIHAITLLKTMTLEEYKK